MKVKIGLTALLVGTLGVSAVAVAAPVAASGGPALPSQVETMTISGEFQHLAIDRTDGEELRYAVRSGDEMWWLEAVAEPAPAAGSQVTVTGTRVDQYTLSVDTITVTTAAAMSRAAALAPRSTRVLVLRAFWTRRPPAQPTTRATMRKVIRGSNAWFREVSHRRYRISGAVTPWLRVRRPGDCVNDAFPMMNQALRAAQRRGFVLARFQRAILYIPCPVRGLLGFATVPGQHVWLFNTIGLHVVVHEQGHNLGLQHAGSRVCRSPQWGRVTWGPRCQVIEYGDEIDAMGNLRPGHFNGSYKSRLGWLQRAATVRSTRIVTLRPAETIGRGLKAVRVRAGRATYWVEYRTRAGYDRSMPAGTNGVQIRFQRGPRTQLLDAGPGSARGFRDFVNTRLPVGSSWTTPQKVRIAVLRQRPSSATVAIRFRAGAPKAPGRPGPVRVQALNNAARITWTRPADNGSILRRYVITRNGGTSRAIRSFAGLRRSYVWSGLRQSQNYRFTVRAVNQAGRSRPAVSPTVRPR